MRDVKLSNLRICLEVLRRENLTETARVLNMTQSAVSKSVQLVEKQVGMPLFRRSKSGVVPQDNARPFLYRIAEGVSIIDDALTDLADVEGRGILRIVAPPIIAQRFIIPHLDDLGKQHPGLELVFRVRTASTQRNADTDAEITFNGGSATPPGWEWLIGDRFWVVGHPNVVPENLPITEVTKFPLLQHVKVEKMWFDLASRFGLDFGKTKFHYYEQYSLIIEAVLQKQGVAVVPRFLIGDAVATGRLRRVGEEIAFPQMGYYYHLVRREKAATSRKFYSWLNQILQSADTSSIPNRNI